MSALIRSHRDELWAWARDFIRVTALLAAGGLIAVTSTGWWDYVGLVLTGALGIKLGQLGPRWSWFRRRPIIGGTILLAVGIGTYVLVSYFISHPR